LCDHHRGEYTFYTQGSSVLSFNKSGSPPSSLTVNFFNAINDTLLMANVTVPVSSPLGNYTATITDSIDGTFSGSFITINAGSLSGITPNIAPRGQTLNVTITGNGTAFVQGSTTVAFFNSGTSTMVKVNSVVVNASNMAVANITVQPNAVAGGYDLRVTTPLDGLLQIYGAFTVTGPVISTGNVSPTNFYRGTKLPVFITGTNTHFNQGTGTAVYFYRQGSPTSDIKTDSTSSVGASTITAFVTVSKTAVPGTYQLRTNNATDYEIIYSGNITVNNPALKTINPPASVNNRVLDIMITGSGTNFSQASATNFAFFYSGTSTNNIVINSVNAINDSLVDLNVNVIPTAATGVYNMVYNSPDDGNLSIYFVVNTGSPSILSMSPASAKRGQTLDVTISGQNTAFLQASTTLTTVFMRSANPSPFFKINSRTVTSDNLIKLNVTIDSSVAALGIYSLSVGDTIDGYLSPTYPFNVLNVGVSSLPGIENGLSIYPNPVKEYFFIELKTADATIEQIIITDLIGRKVFEQQNPVLQNGLIKLESGQMKLHPGTYFIIVQTQNGNYFRKLLIE
ncbi:MAG: T9SS type A sorting domain-containing protein, partial [Bacteroidia bacterium]